MYESPQLGLYVDGTPAGGDGDDEFLYRNRKEKGGGWRETADG